MLKLNVSVCVITCIAAHFLLQQQQAFQQLCVKKIWSRLEGMQIYGIVVELVELFWNVANVEFNISPMLVTQENVGARVVGERDTGGSLGMGIGLGRNDGRFEAFGENEGCIDVDGTLDTLCRTVGKPVGYLMGTIVDGA
jgi:hypothetical protein